MCTTYQLRHTCGHCQHVSSARCQRAVQTLQPCRRTEAPVSQVLNQCPDCLERAAAAANAQLLGKIEQQHRTQSAEQGQLAGQAGDSGLVYRSETSKTSARGRSGSGSGSGSGSESSGGKKRRDANSVWDTFECDFCGAVCVCNGMFPGHED